MTAKVLGGLPRLPVILLCLAALAGLGAEQKRPASRKPSPPFQLPAAVQQEPATEPMPVAPLGRGTRPAIEEAAAAIDALLAARHREQGLIPSAALDDAQFVRRAYLDLGGRIPTHDEAAAFLAENDPGKRGALIDRLLESPDYVSRFYNVWADTLRLTERPQKNLWCEPYLDWVKRSIAANRPYDQWVYEMLTANGKTWENPAVGYQLRDQGMPLPFVDNTVRVFLGTQIGCAQCHDHPFDSWTQQQFYELAAFTSGTRSGLGGKPGKPARDMGRRGEPADAAQKNIQGLLRETRSRAEATERKKVDNQFLQFLQANGTRVSFRERPLQLPHDSQDSAATSDDPVAPQVLWGEVPTEARALDQRAQFAAWLTSGDNRQFARTIANRMWKLLMGVGIVEPIDDFRPGNPPSDPELMEHLTDLVLRLDFDLRAFVRVIASTATWQRRAVPHDPTSGLPFAFTSPALRRMSAEQLWDSILTLVAHDPWAYQRPTAAEFAAGVDLNLSAGKVSWEDAHETYERFQKTLAPQRTRRLMLRRYGYMGQVLARASELPTPLPLGHFLRQFGQGDRETIDGGRTVATIPQILAMFNGPITHSMLQRGSMIQDEIAAHDPGRAIDIIFLSVLTHSPDAEDRMLAMEEMTAAGDTITGCNNVIWALLNTREFIFIQ